MITALSLLVWCFTLVVAVRLFRRDAAPLPGGPGPRTLGALVLVAFALLGRPHELLLSGQDPGVYLNAAGAYQRHQALTYIDPMLAQIPVETQPDFCFGHTGYRQTKDSILEIKDSESARLGPRFPVLYSVLIAPLINIGVPPLALGVTPLFALLTALVLMRLMPRLTGHPWSGLVAAAVYLATPLLVWHARAPRPELVAGFFGLAGFTLMERAWRSPDFRRAWPDLLLASLCVSLAPLLHVTAWFMAVAAAAVVGVRLAAGRPAALIHPPIAMLGLGLFMAQIVYIGDQYQLTRYFRPHLERPDRLALLALAIMGVCLLLVIAARALARTRAGRAWSGWSRRPGPALAVGLVAAGLLLAIACVLVAAHPPLDARRFDGYHYAYSHPTDLRFVRLLLSTPVALAGLAGLLVLAFDRRPGQGARLAWLAWMLPGAALVGPMQDFFLTRYLIPYALPMTAGGVAALLCALPWRRLPPRLGGAGLALVAAVLLAWPLPARRGMLTVTEHRGLARDLAAVAAPIRAADGILLAEYARLATPLEHFFGVPLLSLDNETRLDYRRALSAWDTLMARSPDRPAFFLTPFGPPLSEYFDFMPVATTALTRIRLDAGRHRLPATSAQLSPVTLTLYRMTRDGPAPAPPTLRIPDAGNMGWAGFGRTGASTWAFAGPILPARTPATLALPAPATWRAGDRLLLFLYVETPDAEHALPVPADGPAHKSSFISLDHNWHVLDLEMRAPPGPEGLTLHGGSAEAVVAEAWRWRDGEVTALSLPPAPPSGLKAGLSTRWIPDHAALLLPTPENDHAPIRLAALLMAPHPKAAIDGWSLRTSTADLGPRHPPQDRWSWQLWVLPNPTNALRADALRSSGPPPPRWFELMPTRTDEDRDAVTRPPAGRIAAAAAFTLPP